MKDRLANVASVDVDVVAARLSAPFTLSVDSHAVDDAINPPRSQIGVVVEFTVTPKFVVGVKSKSDAPFCERKYDADVVENPRPADDQ